MKSELISKEVDFNGSKLMAIKKDGELFVAVKWVCLGIGFDERKSRAEVERMTYDIVLSKGCQKIGCLTNGGIQDTMCININYLPLWLAKINANIIEDTVIQNNLIEYQLKAKDVLAEAFISKKFKVPQNMKEALLIALEQQEEIERLELENTMQKQEIETNKPKVDYYNTILADTTSLLTVTQIAKDYNLTAVALNKILKENKIQYKQSNQWLLYAEHLNKGFVKSVTHIVDGRPFLSTKWTQRGRIFIHELLSKLGIKAVMDTQEAIF